ncbi:M48 family metalloprotease [Glycomyces albidus]|uniref:M48 family metalloprotease n=1 Tax=Glycomyces albidus TaxID=2656774 RepID=A0A6L5GEV3_9ACTN|nr:M48 family metallopeptidase [Glycomyces albidus]MQM28115.1 M48 family metalloprotease [Glycomyces albidus]
MTPAARRPEAKRLPGLRTASHLVLTGAVPAAMLAVMTGLIWFNAYAFTVSTLSALKIAIGVVPTAAVLGSGLWVLVFKGDKPLPGVPVHEHEHPDLWALVRGVAAAVGTAPPDRILLTADANAAVMEDTRLLGLVAARRHMTIGAPLVAEMTAPQLAAVIGHELGHYAARDTRFSAAAYRSRRAFVHTLTVLNRDDYLQRAMHFLLRHYGLLVVRGSANLSRRQERLADEAAATAVGSAATAAAFAALTSIAATWDLFRRDHLRIAWDQGFLPADAFAGFRSLRASLGDEPIEADEPDPYDTHPPMHERIAAVEALAAPGELRILPGEASSLLRDPARLLDAALLDGLEPEARAMRRADWTALVRLHVLASLAEPLVAANAARALGRPPTVETLLDALDAGLLEELGTDPDAPQGDPPRVRRERARVLVHKGLTGALAARIDAAGGVEWAESWPFPGAMRSILADPLAALVDAAVADRPDTSRLRALIDSVERLQGRPQNIGTAHRGEDPRTHGDAQGGERPRAVVEAVHGGRQPAGADRPDPAGGPHRQPRRDHPRPAGHPRG